MKRRLEDTDEGFFQNPAKILPMDRGLYINNMVYSPIGMSPQQIGRPVLASTPQTASDCGDGRILTPNVQRTSDTTFHPNPAAERELRHVIDNFVSIYEQLDKNDNPDEKPNYSYSELAYLAMLRSQNFCLPIGQIYSYIQSRFKFFRNSTRKHWKNAVRHSLAKTMCFSKIPVGRGTSNNENLARSTYLWCILPNSIACFARGDYRATIDKESGTNTLRSAYVRMNSEPFWNAVGDYIATKMTLFRQTLEASPSPGLIFESQTCSFPWKQQPTQGATKSYQRREVFQNVQNTHQNSSNKRQRCCEFSSVPPQPQIYHSTTIENALPSTQAQTGPALHMYHAQTRSSSPILRMPDAQSQNQFTNIERATPSHGLDPWLPELAISSPEPSFCSTGLGQGSPSCSSFNSSDSGYVDSSTNDNSLNFLNSCQKQNNGKVLATTGHENLNGDYFSNDDFNLTQFDLSPFTLSDFTDLSESFEQPKITPEKRHPSPPLPHMTSCVGQPMYISTPVTGQAQRGQQCGYIYSPETPVQSYGHGLPSTTPVFFINSEGVVSTAILPTWPAYS